MADKAFLAGINDYETIGDLRGCYNDTHSIRRPLIDACGFDDGIGRSFIFSDMVPTPPMPSRERRTFAMSGCACMGWIATIARRTYGITFHSMHRR